MITKLIALYKARLAEYLPERMRTDWIVHLYSVKTEDYDLTLRHASWMLTEIERMLQEIGSCEQNCRTLEKANRWLGFVQGILFTTGFYTVDQMREHVRMAARVDLHA